MAPPSRAMRPRTRMCNGLIIASVMAMLLGVLAETRADTPPSGHTRSLAVPTTDRALVIDGNLDEEVWQTAALADHFWVIDQKRWASEPTEVLVLADRKHLYFGFRVYDAEPSHIEAVHTRRDTDLGFDDQVVVDLDPYHNHRLISRYIVNARGTQSDEIAGGRARKLEWKGDWQAAVARTQYGWSAEIAIPFAILNYGSSSGVIGVNFARYHHRTREWSRWADLTGAYKPEEMGHLIGIELPQTRQPWLFMPYVLTGHNIPDKTDQVRGAVGNAGLDVRYAPSQRLTAVFSLNPDFSQVERTLTDIDFSYSEKYRADPRPFFAEGADYFDPDGTYFYSNRVPGFDYGAKAFARLGQLQLGGLITDAPGGRRDSVVRVTQELGARHSASLMAVLSDRPDLQNEVFVSRLGGRNTWNMVYSFESAFSRTQGQEGDGHTLQAELGWQSDHWTIGTTWDRYSLNFLPADGLLRTDRPGTQGLKSSATYYLDRANGHVRLVTSELVFADRWTADGRAQQRYWYGGGSIELRQQIKLGLYYDRGTYRPPGTSRGEWAEELNRDHYWTASLDFNTRSDRFNYGVELARGSLGGGDYQYVGSYLWMKPIPRLTLKLTDERLHSFGSFKQSVVWVGWDLTGSDRIAARFLSAEGGTGVRMSYARTVRSGLDVFAVYDRDVHSRAEISLKLLLSIPYHGSSRAQRALSAHLDHHTEMPGS